MFDDRGVGLRPNLINIVAVLLIAVIVAVILKELRTVLQPLFIAIFLFFLADPAVEFLARRKVPFSVAYFLVLGGFFGLVVAGIFGLSEYVGQLAKGLPDLQNRVQDIAVSTANQVSPDATFLKRQVRGMASRLEVIKPLTDASVGFLTRLPGILWDAILMCIYIAFLIQERRTLPRRLKAVYGAEKAARIQLVGERIRTNISRYLYIKVVASAVTAIAALGCMLALGLDLAPLWAAIIFAANFIPYIGSLISFVFPICAAVLQFPEVWKVVALTAFLFGLDFLVGTYWEPRVSGNRLNLSPLVIVLALAFWGWLWGVTGMLLSVPITVSIRFILDSIPYTRPLAAVLSHHTEPEAAKG